MSAKLKVYLAARYSRREEMCRYRNQLESGGHIEVTSRWINPVDESGLNNPISEFEKRAKWAQSSIEDIDSAVVVICFTEEHSNSSSPGARNVAFGYALAKQKFLIVTGPRETVFHCHKTVKVAPNWMTALSITLDVAKAYISSRG